MPGPCWRTSSRTPLRERLGPVRIEGLERLTGGASRESWSFDAVCDDGRRVELVLRRDPPARPGPPGAMALEARAMRCAGEVGVPVPDVLFDTDDTSVFGAAGMVMGRVQGEALARRILRDEALAAARSSLVTQFATALAQLHRADPDALGAAPEQDPLAMIRWILDELGEPVPTFEFALRWLAEHRPRAHRSWHRPRRLPVGQSHGRPGRTGRRARLGTGPPGGPGGGPGLAVRPGLALRRGPAGGGAGGARGAARRLRSCGRCTGRRRGAAVVGGLWNAPLGRHLSDPDRGPPQRCAPFGRAGGDRATGVRSRMGPVVAAPARRRRSRRSISGTGVWPPPLGE